MCEDEDMIDLGNPEVAFAVWVTRQASLLARAVEKEMITLALTKQDRSPVTVADYAVQALVGQAISETFPEDSLVAEEDSNTLRTQEGRPTLERVVHFLNRSFPDSGPEDICTWIDRGTDECEQRFWTLDPIDGTKGFLRGDQYAVALALVVDGKVQIASLGCPKLGQGWLVVAVRGEGCWRSSLDTENHFQPLRVSDCNDPSSARVMRSFESKHTNETTLRELLLTMGVQVEPVLMDSQAKYAVLAAGEGDWLFRFRSSDQPHYIDKIWDHASGTLIVEEAGGRVTDLDGKLLDFSCGALLVNSRGVLASNGLLHEIALKALSHNPGP